MRTHHLSSPPATLRRVRLDNLALFPASLLPYKDQWQEIANRLSHNEVLIILPPTGKPLHKTLETVSTLLEANGHRVTTLLAEQFT